MFIVLIALSETAAYALYPLIGIYLLLAVYALVGGWMRIDDRQQVRLAWLLTLPLGLFLALWFSGNMTWGLLLWLGVGERYVWLATWFSGGVALFVSAIVFVRMATGRASCHYMRVHAWGAGLCAALLGAMRFIHFAEGIDGWTARGAAENSFAYVMKGSEFYPPALPRRIVEETTPRLAADGGKAYAIYVGDQRVSEIHVMPYYRWWWTVSYSRKYGMERRNSSASQSRMDALR